MTRNLLAALAATIIAFAAAPVLAQTAAPQPAPAAAAPAAAAPAASGPTKKAECATTAKGMARNARVDQIQLCMAEGRVACLKDAIAKKVPNGPERIAYLKQCLG